MSIPDIQSLMLPALTRINDDKEYLIRNLIDELAKEFALGPEQLAETNEKSGQLKFYNRVHWTMTHLSKAGLVARTGRGKVQITPRGHNAIADASRGSRINLAYLGQIPEYQEFRARSSTPSRQGGTLNTAPENPTEAIADPSEQMEASFHSLRVALADELLDRIRTMSPRFFERLVLDLLVAMGYGGSRTDAAQSVGGSGDDGIDGIIKEDKLGLDSIYLQAKRWENTVGRPAVQAFAGSLEGNRARKGVFITTSTFSNDARSFVDRIEKRIVLIDGEQLTNLMIDHGVGVADIVVYAVKRVDEDYFEEL